MTAKAFITKLAPYAVEDMKQSGILASLTIAQGCLESGWGASSLTRECNNLFGIKGSYQGKSKTYPTREYVNGQWVTVNAAFRVYPSWAESVADHSALFHNGTRDRPDRYHALIGERDYKRAAVAVRAAGYATDPAYTDKLIQIIEDHQLYAYDGAGEDDISPWAVDARAWVMETGVSDGTRPRDPVTREQVWSMIYRYANKGK